MFFRVIFDPNEYGRTTSDDGMIKISVELEKLKHWKVLVVINLVHNLFLNKNLKIFIVDYWCEMWLELIKVKEDLYKIFNLELCN